MSLPYDETITETIYGLATSLNSTQYLRMCKIAGLKKDEIKNIYSLEGMTDVLMSLVKISNFGIAPKFATIQGSDNDSELLDWHDKHGISFILISSTPRKVYSLVWCAFGVNWVTKGYNFKSCIQIAMQEYLIKEKHLQEISEV